MFSKTREAIRKLILAWGSWRTATIEYREVVEHGSLNDAQRKHLEAAFKHMDNAFEEMEKAFQS